jgi:sugar phosphate isomerase/epimerase
MERRDFLAGAAALTALAAKELTFPAVASAQVVPGQTLVTQIWSRHLQWVSTEAETVSDPYGTGVKVGEACRAAGFAAVDLTVRNGGHVNPLNVATHLPPMLNGIRSTGALCDHIGVNFAPPAALGKPEWIASQFVHEILSVASAHGIKRYRFNNAGGVSFPNNTFGDEMEQLLDNVRVNHNRLAEINAKYGVGGVAHTHGSNIGATVDPYVHSMRDIDPDLIGINLAIGHVATAAPGTAWQIATRRAMPYIKCVAPEDIRATINPTTGALGISRAQPPGPTGTGNGVINWTTFYSILRLGGYSGAAESQVEYTIPDLTGLTTWNFNNGHFADTPQFASAIAAGRITPAWLLGNMKQDSDFIRSRAVAGGWAEAQVI